MLGVKGEVWENWNCDVSATYSQVVFWETCLKDFSITRTARSLDVVADPVIGAAFYRKSSTAPIRTAFPTTSSTSVA